MGPVVHRRRPRTPPRAVRSAGGGRGRCLWAHRGNLGDRRPRGVKRIRGAAIGDLSRSLGRLGTPKPCSDRSMFRDHDLRARAMTPEPQPTNKGHRHDRTHRWCRSWCRKKLQIAKAGLIAKSRTKILGARRRLAISSEPTGEPDKSLNGPRIYHRRDVNDILKSASFEQSLDGQFLLLVRQSPRNFANLDDLVRRKARRKGPAYG